jgi:hypothetical protein
MSTECKPAHNWVHSLRKVGGSGPLSANAAERRMTASIRAFQESGVIWRCDSIGNEADAIERQDCLDDPVASYSGENQANNEERRDVVILLEEADLANREKTE